MSSISPSHSLYLTCTFCRLFLVWIQRCKCSVTTQQQLHTTQTLFAVWMRPKALINLHIEIHLNEFSLKGQHIKYCVFFSHYLRYIAIFYLFCLASNSNKRALLLIQRMQIWQKLLPISFTELQTSFKSRSKLFPVQNIFSLCLPTGRSVDYLRQEVRMHMLLQCYANVWWILGHYQKSQNGTSGHQKDGWSFDS